ncbi:hypothetical protein LCGC14_0729760 [marine sediment metagenome]|uniref:Uncharacterized protein n=1 Tax=marine sediment metagenome TaxID=412755 RepID=A0A0F9Q9Y6_9ZZZZ
MVTKKKKLTKKGKKSTLLGFFKPGANAKGSAIVLKKRRERTAMRILESRGASVSTKARARRVLA